MKKYLKKIVYAFLLMVCFPAYVFSANITVESTADTLHVGDQVVLKVILDTEKLNINTIDGEIAITDNANAFIIKEISIANSKFTLWPRKPSLSTDRRIISFVGGVPGGIKDENILVFNIIVEALRPGKIILSERNTTILLHDGKGTSIKPTFPTKTINVIQGDSNTVIKDEWSGVVSTDTIPPKEFKVSIGSDESLFDGKKFISFNTTDDESGIDYYIVTEGKLPPARSGSTYVLQNQETEELITVAVFDKAGNVRVAEYDPNAMSSTTRALIIVSLILLSLLTVWYFKYRNIKNETE